MSINLKNVFTIESIDNELYASLNIINNKFNDEETYSILKKSLRSMLVPLHHNYVESWHPRFLDMAIIFYINYKVTDDDLNYYQYKPFIIPETMIDLFNIDGIQNLINISIENNRHYFELRDLNKIFGADDSYIKYALSTDMVEHGSCYLMDTSILTDICYRLKSDKCYIIPSSIDELIIPDYNDETFNKKKIIDTIKECNENGDVINKNEVLSNNLYVFNLDSKKVSIEILL